MIEEKNIGVCLLLTIVTCGIYGIFWFISMTDDMRYLSKDQTLSGGSAFLFSILTCGIYNFYWVYKMDRAARMAMEEKDVPSTDKFVLYIILQALGLGIVNYCLIQSDLNILAKNN